LIKHHRHEHFKKATLANSLDALAGLFTLNLYYYQKLGLYHSELRPQSQLFEMGYEYFATGEGQWVILPDNLDPPLSSNFEKIEDPITAILKKERFGE